MNARLRTAIQHWSYVAPVLQPARNAKEYAALVEALDAALDAGGADENHPLARPRRWQHDSEFRRRCFCEGNRATSRGFVTCIRNIIRGGDS